MIKKYCIHAEWKLAEWNVVESSCIICAYMIIRVLTRKNVSIYFYACVRKKDWCKNVFGNWFILKCSFFGVDFYTKLVIFDFYWQNDSLEFICPSWLQINYSWFRYYIFRKQLWLVEKFWMLNYYFL